MAIAKQHIPDLPELKDLKPESSRFGNCSELLDLPWVSRWKEHAKFHRWCKSAEGDILMIENKDGTWWWIIAYVPQGAISGLPTVRCVQG